MQTLYTWDSSSPCRRKQGLRGVPFAFGSLQSLPTPSSSSPRDNSLSSGPSRSACRGWPAPAQAFFLLWRAAARTDSKVDSGSSVQGLQKCDTPCTLVFFKMLSIRALRIRPVQGLRYFCRPCTPRKKLSSAGKRETVQISLPAGR